MNHWAIVDMDTLVQSIGLGCVAFYVIMRIGAWMFFPERTTKSRSKMW